MPIYEWRCTTQECPVRVFELSMTIAQIVKHPDVVCPNCGKPARRVLSTFGGKFGDTPKHHR